MGMKLSFRTLITSFVLLMIAFPVLGQEPVTIRMMEFARQEELEWQRAVVEAFHQDQDRIRIELIGSAGEAPVHKAVALWAAGIPPHIAYGDPQHTISWGRQGIALDLTPFFERDYETSPFVDFHPVMLDLHSIPGKRYGIPLDLQVQAFFYAEKPFAEAGLAYPDETWTWDTVAKMAQRLTEDKDGDGSPERWGMRDPQYLDWWSLLWHFGGEFVNDPKVPTAFVGDSQEAADAMNWVYRMIHEVKAMPRPESLAGDTAENLVMQESVAMAIGNSLYVQQARKYVSDVPWDVVALPSGPAGNASVANAIGWSIFAAAGDHDAAWEVLKYFSSEKAMRMSVEMRGTLVPHLPVAREVWMNEGDVPANRHVFIEAMLTARPLPVLYGNAWNSTYYNPRYYWNGLISWTQAVENMRVDVENWIKQLGLDK